MPARFHGDSMVQVDCEGTSLMSRCGKPAVGGHGQEQNHAYNCKHFLGSIVPKRWLTKKGLKSSTNFGRMRALSGIAFVNRVLY